MRSALAALAALMLSSSLSAQETPVTMKYLAVPMSGEVGKEITARGVRAAVRAAKQKKADAVVFVIDTNGGRVADAEAISRVMEEERGNLRYYSLVVKTFSAGVWTLAQSDQVFFAPGGPTGAAVCFSYKPETGSAEVDAKFCAAVAAKLAGIAEAHGQLAPVYRAMVVKDERLFRFKDPGGRVCVSNLEPPAGSKDVREIDTSSSVLALTPAEAEEIGFGAALPSADPAEIGRLIGVTDWAEAGPPAKAMMVHAAKEVQAKAEAVATAADRVKHARDSIIEYASRLPNQASIAASTGPSNPSTWTQQCNAAIREWNEVLSLCNGIDQAKAAADRAVRDVNAARAREYEARLLAEKPEEMAMIPVELKQDVAAYRRQANQMIARLRSERSVPPRR
jgi:hypothetical protein